MSEIIENDNVNKDERNRPNEDGNFLIVGLGASAGGIKAFKDFFVRVPEDSGMAYVVILHLSPEHDSKLAEILQISTQIPVTQVTEGVKIEPNHVYVIPPNKSLSLQDGHLVLSEIVTIEERRAPVDIFLRKLAETYGPRAISVILSGTGANGSMGMKRVKERGGIAIVQDPKEAEYSDMPRNSIATGFVDYVLPVAEIPAKLIAYQKHIKSVHIESESLSRSEADEQSLRDIFTQLRIRTGHDFSNYKRATILRRIERRMSVHELENLPDYALYMREHQYEASALLKDLLISVTNFFRDHDAFQALQDKFIPRLFEGKEADAQVRVWVAGCATGEEAYSVAMLIAEYTSDLFNMPTVQIFATDIDEAAIAVARDGFYTDTDVADVSPERLRRFFTKEADGYRVRRDLREMILFASHNLIKAPPFSHLDLVTCRNLLIYLNRTAQERAMEVLHFALKPGAYMFLGSSESINGASDLFIPIDKDHHIFQSRAVSSRLTLPIPELILNHRVERPRQENQTRALERVTYVDLHQRLIEEYGPPSVVVNEDYEIVHLSQQAGRYMKVIGGEPTHNLLKMVHSDLRLELRTALYQAVHQGVSVEAKGLNVKLDDRMETINLVIRPVMRSDDPARGFILVVFEQATGEGEGENKSLADRVNKIEPAARQLEEELMNVKEQLRVTVEQYEIQHEEFRASNEELHAMNEELRSAAEELETSKEELQSVNEELTTVNQELKIKIEELSQANNDFQNLMASTEIATIFLDRSLRVKLFTPRSRDIFNLIPADVNRPLLDITNKLLYKELLTDIEQVLDKLQTVEREVETSDNGLYLMRLLPYRTIEDRIDGVVITFVDVSDRRQTKIPLSVSEEHLRLLIESAKDYAIFSLTKDGLINTWNAGAERVFGYKEKEILGKPSDILFTPEDRERGVPEDERERALTRGRAADERWHLRQDGTQFFASGVMTPLRVNGEIEGFVKIARDLTDQKEAEEALQSAYDELESRVVERTHELSKVNDILHAEVSERAAAEARIRDLLRQLVTAQESERSRIARDLHDQLGQELTALRLKLDSLKTKCGDSEELCAQVEETQAIAQRLDEEVDFLAWELRPASLDEFGLAAALENFVQEWSKHFGIHAEFHSNEPVGERYSLEVETNLYRIAQEALNNIFKHAEATRAGVILERRDGYLVLIIEDNGKGFNPNEKIAIGQGIGLINMRERASFTGGNFEIESQSGKGSTVYVRVPMTDERAIGDSNGARPVN